MTWMEVIERIQINEARTRAGALADLRTALDCGDIHYAIEQIYDVDGEGVSVAITGALWLVCYFERHPRAWSYGETRFDFETGQVQFGLTDSVDQVLWHPLLLRSDVEACWGEVSNPHNYVEQREGGIPPQPILTEDIEALYRRWFNAFRDLNNGLTPSMVEDFYGDGSFGKKHRLTKDCIISLRSNVKAEIPGSYKRGRRKKGAAIIFPGAY